MKKFLALIVMGVTAALSSGPLHSEESYPSKPITIVVPFPPGGPGDSLARLLGRHLTDRLGQPIIVDNKPGASTLIGSDAVQRSKPDGYTLLLMSSSLTTLPATNPGVLRFDPLTDLSLISKLVQMPLVLVAGKTAPFRSISEFIEYAKAHPGEVMVGVAPGVGGNAHLAFERLKLEAGIDATAVPYKGSAPATQALLTGEVPATINAVPEAVPHINAGNAYPLAVMTADRMSGVPDIPTVSESGLPDYEADTWTGLAGPPGMKAELVDFLQNTFHEVLQIPEVKERLISLGMEPVGSTPAEFQTTVETNIRDWKRVATEANVKIVN